MRKMLAMGLIGMSLMGATACSNDLSTSSDTVTVAGTEVKAGDSITVKQFTDTYGPEQDKIKAVHAVTSMTTEGNAGKNITMDSYLDEIDEKNKKSKSDVTIGEQKYGSIRIGKDSWTQLGGKWQAVPAADALEEDESVYTSRKLLKDMGSGKNVESDKVVYVGKEGDDRKFKAVVPMDSTDAKKGNSEIFFTMNKDSFLVNCKGTLVMNDQKVTLEMKQSDFNKPQKIEKPV